MGRCQVEGCESKLYLKGYCCKHYRQITRHGKLTPESEQHGGARTRLYRILKNMKSRCSNPKATRYEHYGGKGVKICKEWLKDFREFRKWAESSGYADNLTIDRIDSDGDYEPSNCRWLTLSENSRRSNLKKNDRRRRL